MEPARHRHRRLWLLLATVVLIGAVGLIGTIGLTRPPAPDKKAGSVSDVLKCYQCARNQTGEPDCDSGLGDVVECKKGDSGHEPLCALISDDTGEHPTAPGWPGRVFVRGCGERRHSAGGWYYTPPPPPCKSAKGWRGCFCNTELCNTTPDDVDNGLRPISGTSGSVRDHDQGSDGEKNETTKKANILIMYHVPD